ncbi:MAG TPA: hypothetical protein VID72_08105 [Ktedonobacterales bacterium]
MLTFTTDMGRFNFRTVGVCIEDGYVLAQRFEGSDVWVLPGGRVEMGEELPIPSAVEITRLLWVVENFFTPEPEIHYHELAFYYLMALPVGCDLARKDAVTLGEDFGASFELRWLPLDTLATLPLVPLFLRASLLALPAAPEHLICHEGAR